MNVFETLWTQLKEAARDTARAGQIMDAQQAEKIVDETLRKMRLENTAEDVRDYFARSLVELVDERRKDQESGKTHLR